MDPQKKKDVEVKKSWMGVGEGDEAEEKNRSKGRGIEYGNELANNLFSFNSARHGRQHLYRFVDYVNTEADEKKENIKSVRPPPPPPSVAMATYFMLRESHKGGREQSRPYPVTLVQICKKGIARCIFNKA
ncbi:hypothetical protein CEXT_23451 [Caerostris extrusa]|uniref:Uncharacterized protein n=1 Tax=Caerostris extrusa TaxID=172846 RepID=A0AAV4PCG2_CAEEX|nr:hypothetical protein CEXT_23451 [Caerostris extrusa]